MIHGSGCTSSKCKSSRMNKVAPTDYMEPKYNMPYDTDKEHSDAKKDDSFELVIDDDFKFDEDEIVPKINKKEKKQVGNGYKTYHTRNKIRYCQIGGAKEGVDDMTKNFRSLAFDKECKICFDNFNEQGTYKCKKCNTDICKECVKRMVISGDDRCPNQSCLNPDGYTRTISPMLKDRINNPTDEEIELRREMLIKASEEKSNDYDLDDDSSEKSLGQMLMARKKKQEQNKIRIPEKGTFLSKFFKKGKGIDSFEDIIKDESEIKDWAIGGSQAINYWLKKYNINNEFKTNDHDYYLKMEKPNFYQLGKSLNSKVSPSDKNKSVYENVVDGVDIFLINNIEKENNYLTPELLLKIYQDNAEDDFDGNKNVDKKIDALKLIISKRNQNGKGDEEDEEKEMFRNFGRMNISRSSSSAEDAARPAPPRRLGLSTSTAQPLPPRIRNRRIPDIIRREEIMRQALVNDVMPDPIPENRQIEYDEPISNERKKEKKLKQKKLFEDKDKKGKGKNRPIR